MTRTQAFFFTLGILMILYGVAGKSWLTDSEGGPGGAGRADAPSGPDSSPGSPMAALPKSRRTPAEAPAPRSTGKTKTASAQGAEVTIPLMIKYADTGLPCEGARVELLRIAKGEGAAFRPAIRLSGPKGRKSDRDGRVSFTAERGVGVEVIAHIEREGPMDEEGPIEKVVIGALEQSLAEPIEIRLRRPPSPLVVTVTDSAQRPIPGVSIRIVSNGARPSVEYSASGVLGSRTGGDGKSSLRGKARAARWLLLDAPGYSPMAVSLQQLDPQGNIQASMPADTSLELDVVDNAGNALVSAVVEVEFSLDGFTTGRSAQTDKRGHVTIAHLPAETPLRPIVTPEGGLPQTVEVLEGPPGEALRATLHVVQ